MLIWILFVSCYFNLSNASVNIKLAPKLGRVLPSQHADVNASLQLLCSVRQGEQPLFFEWYKNSKLIKQGVNVEIENSKQFSLLNFPRLIEENAGNYSCLVKNTYGSDSINVVLTIRGMNVSKLSTCEEFVRDINVWRYRYR